MNLSLWIDDERPKPVRFELHALDYDSAISFLEHYAIDLISFDHDLGEDKTGYDVACYIERRAVDEPCWTVPAYLIHSANPVGRENIRRAMESARRLSAQA